MRSHHALLAAMSLTLAACAHDLHAGLAPLEGQPSRVAIAKLGPPDREQNVAGWRVLLWDRAGDSTVVVPTRGITVGQIGRRPVVLQSGGYHRAAVACRIRLVVDDRDIIVGGDYEGNIDACAAYARKLER